MTNQIEQEFFEAFGTEPKQKNPKHCDIYKNCTGDKQKCSRKDCPFFFYPQITAEIILKLIEVIQQYLIRTRYINESSIMEFRIDKSIKEQTLNACIQLKDEIQSQIKELFNGK